LYGRGTVDAKGPLCAFILAAAEARQPIANSQWQIVVIGATEEEAASSKGAHYAATQYRPELCIIGEPSGSDGITLGYKGRLLVTSHFEYEIQHTSRPGASASEVAVNFWNWVKRFTDQYNADKSKAFDQILPSLRSIKSGDDGLHEWCDMVIGLRLPVEFGYRQASEIFADEFTKIELTGALDRATAGFREESPKHVNSKGSRLEFWGHEQAYRSSKDTVLARAFVDAIREEKLRPAFKVKSGTADFNILGPAWGCPIVAYGPGDSDLDHTPNEHVAIDEFERGVRVLARVLRSVTS
jgi:LysW-gamma-L-lysine carboxypeptidase